MRKAEDRLTYRDSHPFAAFLAHLLVVLFLVGAGSSVSKGEGSSAPPSIHKTPNTADIINISADSLMIDRDKNTAEFRGNVKALQGDLTISADRINIAFRDDITVGNTSAANEMDFRQIAARGNIRLTFDNKIALADKAVYHTDTQILVLSGKNTKILMGENSITGTQVTFHRVDGRVEVEGGGGTRVKGLFYNNNAEQGLSTDGQPSP